MKNVLIASAVVISLLVIPMDRIMAFGLTFMGPSHYSVPLILLLIVACALDLPGVILAVWRPRLGVALIVCGILGTLLYWLFFFSSIRQYPTAKVAIQITVFVALKAILAWLLISIPRAAAPHPET
jgi:hypothetical protein